jgi:hypothetical protein
LHYVQQHHDFVLLFCITESHNAFSLLCQKALRHLISPSLASTQGGLFSSPLKAEVEIKSQGCDLPKETAL